MRYLATIIIVLFYVTAVWAEDIEEIEFSFVPLKDKFVLNEPVLFEYSVKNNSDKEIELNLGSHKKGQYIFEIVRPDGTHERPVGIHTTSGGFIKDKVEVLKKGQEYRKILVLDEFIEWSQSNCYRCANPNRTNCEPVPTCGLSQLGIYKIKVQHHANVKIANAEENTFLNQETVWVLEILPEDSEKLNNVSRDYMCRALNAFSYETAKDMALALSFVNDDVAIPYLIQVLDEQYDNLGYIAFEGLVRIDSVGSKLALKPYIDHERSVYNGVPTPHRRIFERLGFLLFPESGDDWLRYNNVTDCSPIYDSLYLEGLF